MLSKQIANRLEECVNETARSFAMNDLQQAARDATRLQYMYKIVQELEEVTNRSLMQ